jgi:hypothetical protein
MRSGGENEILNRSNGPLSIPQAETRQDGDLSFGIALTSYHDTAHLYAVREAAKSSNLMKWAIFLGKLLV